MPIYLYECPRCGEVDNVWANVSEDRKVHEECGATMTRLISAPAVRGDLEPYLETNMGHEPVYVKSRRHRERLCKDRGLTIRDWKEFRRPTR